MPDGTPVNRNFVVILTNGTPAIDWGEGLFQDILSGDFVHGNENDVDHTIQDEELDLLVKVSRAYSYNVTSVSLYPLPERPRRTLD